MKHTVFWISLGMMAIAILAFTAGPIMDKWYEHHADHLVHPPIEIYDPRHPPETDEDRQRLLTELYREMP